MILGEESKILGSRPLVDNNCLLNYVYDNCIVLASSSCWASDTTSFGNESSFAFCVIAEVESAWDFFEVFGLDRFDWLLSCRYHMSLISACKIEVLGTVQRCDRNGRR